MPALMVGARNGENGEPVVWYCSDCEKAFAPPRMRYTRDDLKTINRQFRSHCDEAHPGSAVLGLKVPNEDMI
jgi:hypothetical protein